MYQTFEQRQRSVPAKGLYSNILPLSIDWNDGGRPASISFSDGTTSNGSCVRCLNPPCMGYSEEELRVDVFKDFPLDRNNAVCPTSAIRWPMDTEAPVIESQICISCGLCVARCPVRAIHLDHDGAHVNDLANSQFRVLDSVATRELVARQVSAFEGVSESGRYLTESDVLLESFFERLILLTADQGAQFPNHLARNLLIGVGVGAAMRRRGDTNIRMDLILGPPGVDRGTGEVEFGSDLLDAPRNVLDNVAVLVARYHVSKDEIIPLVVCLALPNMRSDYWQVIKDVRDVLGLGILTITVGTLAILLWNRVALSLAHGAEPYLDIENLSLRPTMEGLLGRQLNLTGEGYPGLLESAK